jgi:hypothetical protein
MSAFNASTNSIPNRNLRRIEHDLIVASRVAGPLGMCLTEDNFNMRNLSDALQRFALQRNKLETITLAYPATAIQGLVSKASRTTYLIEWFLFFSESECDKVEGAVAVLLLGSDIRMSFVRSELAAACQLSEKYAKNHIDLDEDRVVGYWSSPIVDEAFNQQTSMRRKFKNRLGFRAAKNFSSLDRDTYSTAVREVRAA